MCTALSLPGAVHCFGRTLDLERSYGESVTVMPRNLPLAFCGGETLARHHAMIGMAHVAGGVPLYYEATNEHGLSMAALNFPRSAVYHPHRPDRINVAPFALIPFVLGRCADLAEARALLEKISIRDMSFSPALPATPLHWLAADSTGALTAESTGRGLRLYENEFRVLTNEPPFPFHRDAMALHSALRPEEPGGALFSRGLGSFGLPGGLDSASRFIRAAFTARHARPGDDEAAAVSLFFRILGTVAQTAGCCRPADGTLPQTRYTCCCTDRGLYCYTTAANPSLTAVDLHREDLDGSEVVAYPLRTALQLTREN